MMKLLLFAAMIGAIFWLVKRAMTPPEMPRAEAAKLLGVPADASAEDVAEAHRRLIARVHPDAGGNAELAARINQARDTLLRP